MTSREERVARNEATTREINEVIEQAHTEAGLFQEGDEYIRVLCECGLTECDRVLAITLAEYEALRADPKRFAVAADHVMADLEEVVARTDRYVVVAKREGTPAEIAIEQDPRG
jgi:5-bromo-4-chloroindolyl phosphate hydrolysis protein